MYSKWFELLDMDSNVAELNIMLLVFLFFWLGDYSWFSRDCYYVNNKNKVSKK